MNIIKRELKANMKSLIIWSACIILIFVMMMSEFSAYYNNPAMADILDSMPEAMLKAFSMNGANLTTVSGFVSIANIYFYIMLGIYAVLLGSSIISKEERDKTVEFLFALPISRKKVITSKLIAAVINCFILLSVTGITGIVATMKYQPSKEFFKFWALSIAAIFIIQIVFLSIGMLIASLLKRYKKAGAVSISILLVTYLLSILIGLSDKIEFMKYFTPFKYFEPLYLLNEEKLQGVYIIISLGIIVVSIIGTFIFYPKRDLHIS
ncbi:ABC transporter permease subunit [Clostridium grantii]|uniref:ABC-2 type transport system permease protein n=1 Tax=Clostridium grantii DSM 8605 TaxID=1121316 RepID=A0A1M5VDK7_9CLOT|nr:ABC transporter permease subunit [Clostridium grantii]SHH73310.1 ABC-2 type transport system permease protein [Clostridium grantii DSM 8605]